MSALARLERGWVYGGALAGLLLLALAPTLTAGWDAPSTCAFLALPAYMLHQYEEHDDDRFRRFVNEVVAGGREALGVPAVFWINMLGVWVPLGLAIGLARDGAPGWAALSAWLLLVNGLLHVAQAVALRRYNPGLATGALVFLPLGTVALTLVRPVASAWQVWLCLALVVAVHAAIVLHVRSSLKRAGRVPADTSKGV